VFCLACTAFFAPVLPASQAPDTNARSVSRINNVSSGSSQDTALIVDDHPKVRITPTASAVASSDAAKDSPAGTKSITGISTAGDTLKTNTSEMFHTLGRFHKGMGIFTVAAGAIAIIAGASILEKQDILPFSLSLITIGGVAAGIGMWEIRVGWSISKSQRIK
jgi:hypothetical protein